nr:uncharacterized protein LOC127349181 [Lolium perenne]
MHRFFLLKLHILVFISPQTTQTESLQAARIWPRNSAVLPQYIVEFGDLSPRDGAIFVCEHVRGAVSSERFRTNPSISTFPSSPIYICQIKRRCLLQHRRGIILEEARLYSSNPHLLLWLFRLQRVCLRRVYQLIPSLRLFSD